MFETLEYDLDIVVVCVDLSFQLFEFAEYFLVGHQQFPHFGEYPDNLNVDFYRPFTVEYAGEHYGTMFCKDVGKLR